MPTGTVEDRGDTETSLTAEVLHRQATVNCKGRYKQHVEFGVLKDVMLCTKPFHHCAPNAEIIQYLLGVEYLDRDEQ